MSDTFGFGRVDQRHEEKDLISLARLLSCLDPLDRPSFPRIEVPSNSRDLEIKNNDTEYVDYNR